MITNSEEKEYNQKIVLDYKKLISEILTNPKYSDRVFYNMNVYTSSAKPSDFDCAVASYSLISGNIIVDGYYLDTSACSGAAIVIPFSKLDLPKEYILSLCERHYDKESPVKFTKADSFDLSCKLTLKKYIELIGCGAICNYDGQGYYGHNKYVSNVTVDFDVDDIDKTLEYYKEHKFNCIYWYNK